MCPRYKSTRFLAKDEAIAALKRLRLTSYRDFLRIPKCQRLGMGLPANPFDYYGSFSWNTVTVGRKMPFTEARALVRSLKFKTREEYVEHYANYPRLPSNPHLCYKHTGWISWYDFLGKKRKRK